MGNFFAAVAAAMQAFGYFVTVMVRRGGKWVGELLRVPGTPAPAASTAAQVINQPVEDYAATKRLAGIMLAGLEPKAADLRAVPEQTVMWLAVLGRDGLTKVTLADGKTLGGHIRGGQPIRGLVPHDPEAVADVKRSRQASEVVGKRQRTRRQILETAGHLVPT